MANESRVRRIRILILLGLLAVAAVVIAVAVGGGDDSTAKRKQAVKEVGLLEGIPQSGLTLGDPGAPATLEEFVDLQCPFCAQFSRDALPTVIEDYVRDGKVKITLRPLAFIGKDSLTGARAVLAAAEQDQAFGFASAFYANQGPENSGYVTEEFLRKVAGAVDELDAAQLLEQVRSNASYQRKLKVITRRARQLGVTGSPTFFLTRTGQDPIPLKVSAREYESTIVQALDAALGQ